MQQSYTFNQIYFEYRLMVFNLALHYVLNTEDAEEIAQDVFVKVYKNIHNFKEQSSIKTWIYRITVNASLDYIAYKNSKKRFFIFGKRESADKEYLSVKHTDHPGVLLENKETAAMLFSVINTLPETQRTAFLLSKLEGLGNAEIAEIMETSIAAVESLQVRAKKTLREKLGEKFEEYRRKK